MTARAQGSTTVRLHLAGRDEDTRATVSTLAASLRTLDVGGVALVEPTSQVPGLPGMSGAVLVPWPNRLEDGAWWHDGRRLELPVNEPELGHAIHGLLTETDFDVRECDPSFVALHTELEPRPGYPFALAVTVEYRLVPGGLSARIGVTNRSAWAAPVAVGAHPYLRLGSVPLDDLDVSIDADQAWSLDARNLPRVHREVRGAADDPFVPHPVADAPAHVLYHRSRPGSGGLVHSLRTANGLTLQLRADASLPWTQWYVAPELMTDDGPRRAVAVEPMSAPPNALRNGWGLSHLSPGESRAWGWSVRLAQPESRSR